MFLLGFRLGEVSVGRLLVIIVVLFRLVLMVIGIVVLGSWVSRWCEVGFVVYCKGVFYLI